MVRVVFDRRRGATHEIVQVVNEASSEPAALRLQPGLLASRAGKVRVTGTEVVLALKRRQKHSIVLERCGRFEFEQLVLGKCQKSRINSSARDGDVWVIATIILATCRKCSRSQHLLADPEINQES